MSDKEVSGTLTATGITPFVQPDATGVMAVHLVGTGTGSWALIARAIKDASTVGVSDGAGVVGGSANTHRLVTVLQGFEYAVSWTRSAGNLEFTLACA